MLRTYLQDVLGIKSFLSAMSDSESPQLLEREAETREQLSTYRFVGQSSARILFLREATDVSVFEGDLEGLYKKILQSLNRPPHELATLEWTSDLEAVLTHIESLQPQILFALGPAAIRFVDQFMSPAANATVGASTSHFKNAIVIKSIDPADIKQNEDLKRVLWNDLKIVMKHLDVV